MTNWIQEKSWKWQLFAIGGLLLSVAFSVFLVVLVALKYIPLELSVICFLVPIGLWVYICIYLRRKHATNEEKKERKVLATGALFAFFIAAMFYFTFIIITIYPSEISFLKIPLFLLTVVLFYLFSLKDLLKIKRIAQKEKLISGSKLALLLVGIVIAGVVLILWKFVGIILIILLLGFFQKYVFKDLRKRLHFLTVVGLGRVLFSLCLWTFIFLATIIIFFLGLLKDAYGFVLF